MLQNFHTNPILWVSGSFLVSERIYVLEERHSPTPQGQKLLRSRPVQALAYVPLYLAILYLLYVPLI